MTNGKSFITFHQMKYYSNYWKYCYGCFVTGKYFAGPKTQHVCVCVSRSFHAQKALHKSLRENHQPEIESKIASKLDSREFFGQCGRED